MKKIILASLCASLLATPAAAQAPPHARHTIESTHLASARDFRVRLPASYGAQDSFAYPVLYLLDGEHNLAYAESVTRFLEENARIPEMIVVAIPSGATRGYDYAPEYVMRGDEPGRADRFLAFLADEVIPFVESTYRAAPVRVLSGHSMGGVFVTYALAQRPGLFSAYLTQSPYYAEGIGDRLLGHVAGTLAAEGELSAFFYMNLGDEPELEPGFTRMEELLADAASGSLLSLAERAPGETHMTTRLVGQYDGLVRFFTGDWAIALDEISGPSGLEEHIEGLSSKYGYPVLYNESVLQRAAQTAMAGGDFKAAGSYAGLYAEHYAKSPVAHFLSGVAAARGGRLPEARVSIGTAIELYEASPTAELAPLYEQMKSVRSQLGG